MEVLNLIALIGSSREIVEKELEKHNYFLDESGDYGTHTYGVYQEINLSEFHSTVSNINIKYKVVGDTEFVETIIIT